MDEKVKAKKKITIFLTLTFIFSSIIYYLIISAGSLSVNGGIYVLLLMWSPGLSAIITQLVTEKSLRGLGWKWGKTRYQLASLAIPFLYAFVAYLIVWVSGLGKLNTELVDQYLQAHGWLAMPTWLGVILIFLITFLTMIIPGCFSAMGEEIGWRGLFVPELAKVTSYTKTSLISGAVWALWHMPLILFADYSTGVPLWWAVPCFALMVIAISFVYAWMRLKSGSLWTGTFLHASHNLFVQGVFTPLTVIGTSTLFFIDEFGIGIVITSILTAFFFWRKRGELPPAASVE